jgi:para-nitrobenzyl esterase
LVSFPAIDNGQDLRANYGIMDQQFALKWVQQNIAQFGGDPKNVTIFGESAGASSTYYNVISPTANGLFQRAITESTGWTDISPYNVALARGQQFAAAVGCGIDASPATAQCLRSLSTQAIIASGFVDRGPIRTLDGKILTVNTQSAISTGQFNKVDLMIGTNRDEFTWFNAINELTTGVVLTSDAYEMNIQLTYGTNAPLVLQKYPVTEYETPSNALSAVQTDSSWPCQCRRAIRLLRAYVPVWGYLFNDRTAPTYMPPVSFPYKAGHTSEIQYLFKDFHGATGVVRPLSPAQSKLSRTMVSYWTSFARTGNPNSPTTPDWPLDLHDNYQLLELPNARPTLEFSTIHNCDFWDSLL